MDICKSLKTVKENLLIFKNIPFTIEKNGMKLISWNSEPVEPLNVYERILISVDLVINDTRINGVEQFYEYTVTYVPKTRIYSINTNSYRYETHGEHEINFPISKVSDDPSNIKLCFKTKTPLNPDGLTGYPFYDYPSGGYKKSHRKFKRSKRARHSRSKRSKRSRR